MTRRPAVGQPSPAGGADARGRPGDDDRPALPRRVPRPAGVGGVGRGPATPARQVRARRAAGPATSGRGPPRPRPPSARSSSSSIGPPVRTLADPSTIGNRSDEGARQLGWRWAAGVGAAPRGHVVEQGGRRRQELLVVVRHPDAAVPKQHHRPVVHRVVEGRAGQHQPVEQGDGDAGLGAVGQGPQRPVPRRPVEVEDVAQPGVGHGRPRRGAAVGEADVAEAAPRPRWRADRQSLGRASCGRSVSGGRPQASAHVPRGVRRPSRRWSRRAGSGGRRRAGAQDLEGPVGVGAHGDLGVDHAQHRAVGVDDEGGAPVAQHGRRPLDPELARPPCGRGPRAAGSRRRACRRTASASRPCRR